MLKKVYPAVFEIDPVGYGAYFPDIDGTATQGKDIPEVLDNASDVLGIMLADLIEEGYALPHPSDLNSIQIDSSKQFVSFVSVDLNEYLTMNEPVKKTLQIPKWADKRAKEMGINFSQTLTEALLEKLEA
ncbi:type II toxin-antitoxin system HicB family antitoxin [Lactococcus insecticola]|uniref:HicB family protein n=1 Tax=Pseudolactococcus insecticola TaxID=2709158 RepID=A0A6A0B7J2_9LACT|nr:type II toxin-antitoxin system HicB family antitoxin [Lactococcus insecticola]GFH41280.1 HicB family protein [Lactococcus insecticola]